MRSERGERTFSSLAELHSSIEVLARTPGVREMRISGGKPGRITYEHADGRPPSFESESVPDSMPWAQRILGLELRTYTARTLLEGVVHGWSAFRDLGRYPTHVCVWSVRGMMTELFPAARWAGEPALREDLFGMEVVELEEKFNRGTVVICGGRLIGGRAQDADFGLTIVRPLRP